MSALDDAKEALSIGRYRVSMLAKQQERLDLAAKLTALLIPLDDVLAELRQLELPAVEQKVACVLLERDGTMERVMWVTHDPPPEYLYLPPRRALSLTPGDVRHLPPERRFRRSSRLRSSADEHKWMRVHRTSLGGLAQEQQDGYVYLEEAEPIEAWSERNGA